jgi:hypothetical protein
MGEHDEKPALPWWGRFSLAVGESGLWHIGPMRLLVGRRRREISIDYLEHSEPRPDRFFECPTAAALEGPGVVRTRYAFAEAPEVIWVGPALADRAVVVYPEHPFYIPAGESITLYCSTPLWIRVEAGSTRVKLMESAIERPSDTWVGPSTREGEICYATQTTARLERSSVPRHPHRAVTELRIRNAANDTLRLEKVNLSVPYLSIYAGRDGVLWTESVLLEKSSSTTIGRLQIGHPPVPSEVEKLTSARLVSEPGGVLVRAFSALFDD